MAESSPLAFRERGAGHEEVTAPRCGSAGVGVLIGEGDPLVREALKQTLTRCPEFFVAGESEDGHDVLRKVRDNDCDLVLVDFSIPGGGLTLLRQLQKLRPHLPVIVVSLHSEREYVIAAFRAGAFGYVTKASAAVELLKAIRSVSAGRKYVSSSLADGLDAELNE